MAISPDSRDAPSKDVVIQLALRAIRRVHFETQLFSLGQTKKDQKQARQVNVGPGAEAALEDTVRDAFVQEFNSSKLAHGFLSKDDKARYWVVDRQVGYKISDEKTKLVDVEFRRVEPDRPGELDYAVGPIELKRAQLYSLDFGTGNSSPRRKQVSAVAKDIQKLANFVDAGRKGDLKKPKKLADLISARRSEIAATGETLVDMIHPHVLVWGLDTDYLPIPFMSEAFACVTGCRQKNGSPKIAWFPVRWGENDLEPPKMEAWIWVAYAEIEVLSTYERVKVPEEDDESE